MDNTYIQKIRDMLEKNDNIAIAVGKNSSMDEMAAALSLYLLLKEANKKVSIACPTQPIVELTNLVGIDKVASRLDNQEGDFVVSFPYVEGEIEKVSYTLESGFLNIIVKAAGQKLTFDEKDVRYSKGGGSINLLFTIGTPILSDLGEIIEPNKMRDVKIINIDNKRENQGYGDIVAVSADFSSVSEQVADLVLSLGFRIDRDVAQNLLNGIIYATKNFQDAATSPIAFEIASLLFRNGARRESFNTALSQQSPRQTRDSGQTDRPGNLPTRYPQNSQSNSDEQKIPNDWKAPKVYKGSSNF